MPNIPRAAGKGIILLKPETWETLRQVLTDLEIILDPKDFEVTTRAGKKLIRLRPSQPNQQSPGGGDLLPFQVSASPSLLQAAPGVIGSTTVSDDADLKVVNPANGNHYLLTKVVINATTGAIVSEEVYWATSQPSDTTTDFYGAIAYVEITAGEITLAEQYNYGPIYVIVGGGATDIWTVVTY